MNTQGRLKRLTRVQAFLSWVSTVTQLLVKVVLSMASTTPLQLSDISTKLLDSIHLLLKILSLQEVRHLFKKWQFKKLKSLKAYTCLYLVVIVLVRDGMQVKERLVDGPLQLLGHLHAIQGGAPVVLGGLLDGIEDNLAPAGVLVVHELLGMFQLLHGRLLEELGHSRETNIVPVIVV